MTSKPLPTKGFDHNQILAVGVCGHWWQAPNEFEALMNDCPEDGCGRPPGHAFKPRPSGPWVLFHPAAGCEPRSGPMVAPIPATLDRVTKELELGLVLMEIIAADQDYPTRRGLVLQALTMAHALGYRHGIAWDTDNREAVASLCRAVVYIDLPTGQVSWHMPEYVPPWDGHTTDEKFSRIHAFLRGDHERE